MMRPEEVALALLRRWWVIAIVACVAGVVAYGITSSEPKTYTVSTRLMAIAEPPDYWMDLYAKNRLVSYKDLISNWEFVAGALKAAHSDIDPGVAASKLAVGHNPDGNIVQIIVTDTDPARAAEIANALADGFVRRNDAENQQLLEQPRPQNQGAPGHVRMLKLDTPSAPTVPSGPRVKVNTLAGILLGIVAGLALAFLLVYLDDTLKRSRDVDRYLELPILANVTEHTPGPFRSHD